MSVSPVLSSSEVTRLFKRVADNRSEQVDADVVRLDLPVRIVLDDDDE